jgi:hypothetical protein
MWEGDEGAGFMGALFRLASHSSNLRYKTTENSSTIRVRARALATHNVGEVNADAISSNAFFSRTCFTMRIVRLPPKNRHFPGCF